jgi:hypothetical protein
VAEAALFIGFGRPARARELQAIEQFSKALSLYDELREAGEIESFEPVLLDAHGGELQGFFLIRGTREQLVRLRAEKRFRTLVARAGLVVEALGVVDAYIGSGLADQMDLYGEQVEAQLSS